MTAAYAPVFDALHLQSAAHDVMLATHAPAWLIEQRQQARVQQLLQAARGSALYRERMDGDTPALERMAPVRRAELMARFDEWVTDPALRLDELRAFTADASRAGQPWLGRYVVWESSGTSGMPGIFVQDARAMAVYDAIEATRHRPPARAMPLPFDPFGALNLLGAADRHALVTATGGHFASVVSFERLRAINPWVAASSRSFCVMQPVDELVAQLNRFQPTVLATYPTAAALLADEAEAGRLRIRPRCVMMGGETLSRAVRERVARVFGAAVRASYGTSEFLPIAWECAHGHLHVNADWVLLEPVDEQHRPVPAGERSHTVLLTNLANPVQPLIRYDLGDRITWHGEGCACGSRLPVIEVEGRSDDVMRVPARRAGEHVSLLPLALCTVLEEEGGVFDFQLRQQGPSTLVLRLPGSDAAAAAAVERRRRRALPPGAAAVCPAPGRRAHPRAGRAGLRRAARAQRQGVPRGAGCCGLSTPRPHRRVGLEIRVKMGCGACQSCARSY